MPRTHACLTLSLLSLAAFARAQQPPPGGGFDFSAPIHTRPDDGSGPYGIWASGPDYKVSFHDGFAFHPVLGSQARGSLPLRWQTLGVAAGGQSLIPAGDAPRPVAAKWRMEFRYEAVTEAYDVRRDGVEQTFVVRHRPAAAGEIVVTGRVTTPLHAAPFAAAHRAIAFADAEGNPILEYGAAFAVDAAGSRAAVATSFDGELLWLTVPAEFVARAEFPLTIDPLTSRVAVQSNSETFAESDVGTDGESQFYGVMVMATRQVSQADRDVYAWITSSDFSSPVLVFSEISGSFFSHHPSVAFVAGANRWTLAYERDFTRGGTLVARCAVYAHDRADTVFGSGGSPFLYDPNNTGQYRQPDIGGTKGGASGSKALFVCEYDTLPNNQDSNATTVKGIVFDAALKSFLAPFDLSGIVTAQHDRERPSVTQLSAGGATGSWVVVWQEVDHISGTSRIRGNRVAPDQTLATESSFDHLLATGPQFRFWPQVAGAGGRYLVTYLAGDSLSIDLGREVHTLRFDWDEAGATPTDRIGRVLASDAAPPFQLNSPRLAYDSYDTSHWAVLYRSGTGLGSELFARRLGYTGGVVEARTLASNPTENVYAPAIAIDTVLRGFPMTFATSSLVSSNTLFAQRLEYSPDAASIAYGTGCGGTISAPVPNAGYENFLVRLSGAQPAVNAVLLLSNAAANVPLDGLGMPSCRLLVDLGLVALIPVVTIATGGAWVELPLRDAPLIVGDVFCQWVHASPQANPMSLVTTGGLQVRVR